MDLNGPTRPGILVQRRSKEEVVTPLENKEDVVEKEEDKTEEKEEPTNAEGNGEEVMALSPPKDKVRICLIEKVVNYLARYSEMILLET